MYVKALKYIGLGYLKNAIRLLTCGLRVLPLPICSQISIRLIGEHEILMNEKPSRHNSLISLNIPKESPPSRL